MCGAEDEVATGREQPAEFTTQALLPPSLTALCRPRNKKCKLSSPRPPENKPSKLLNAGHLRHGLKGVDLPQRMQTVSTCSRILLVILAAAVATVRVDLAIVIFASGGSGPGSSSTSFAFFSSALVLRLSCLRHRNRSCHSHHLPPHCLCSRRRCWYRRQAVQQVHARVTVLGSSVFRIVWGFKGAGRVL